MPHAREPATKIPPYAASIRPKFASGCSVATKPSRPNEMTPVPIQIQPRCSRTPCQTNHAPPISAIAARTNNRIEHSTVTAGPFWCPCQTCSARAIAGSAHTSREIRGVPNKCGAVSTLHVHLDSSAAQLLPWRRDRSTPSNGNGARSASRAIPTGSNHPATIDASPPPSSPAPTSIGSAQHARHANAPRPTGKESPPPQRCHSRVSRHRNAPRTVCSVRRTAVGSTRCLHRRSDRRNRRPVRHAGCRALP